MIQLPNYDIDAQLYQGKRSTVLRAGRVQDGQSVVIKIPTNEFPTNKDLEKLQHEFDVGRRLQDCHIVRCYALEPYRQGFALIEEDFGAVGLSEIIPDDGWGRLISLTSPFNWLMDWLLFTVRISSTRTSNPVTPSSIARPIS